jgi:hypothetical protein
MEKREVVPGEKYGVFTVVREIPVEQRKQKWNREVEVTCDHGKLHRRSLFHLRIRQNVKCYPCMIIQRDKNRDEKLGYLIGKKYGCWTPVEAITRYHSRDLGRLLLCKCECGEMREICTANLVSPFTRPRCRLNPGPRYQKKAPTEKKRKYKHSPSKRAVLYVEGHNDD